MKLTDEQLAHVAERIVEDQPKCYVCGFFALGTATMRSILAELRHLRSIALSPEEIEALRWLRKTLGAWNFDPHPPKTAFEAAAVLDRLIRGGGK